MIARLILVVLFSVSVSASPLIFSEPIKTGECVTSLPGTFTVFSQTHIEVNIFEDVNGCNPSSDRAIPTYGPIDFQFFGDGSELLTFYEVMFQCNKTYQIDLRSRDVLGAFDTIHDILYMKKCDGRTGGVLRPSVAGGYPTPWSPPFVPPVTSGEPPFGNPPYTPPGIPLPPPTGDPSMTIA